MGEANSRRDHGLKGNGEVTAL
ncbi:hypothetical protein NC652_002563 [Populus alba x Populus x berolinensis]|nr:hypothetical protein NC652_002563 [Populus alba x Populus x berolinensis]